jgi:serine/threonine protein kinase/Tfp pilus assembly protein PilF
VHYRSNIVKKKGDLAINISSLSGEIDCSGDMSQALSVNSIISNYRIVSKLGVGGMGEVYLAEDSRLRRQVALKVLPRTIASDTDRLARFEREAHAASALNHPNILTIHEFGTAGETHFIASEFVQGDTLRERFSRGHLTTNEILDITIQIASALQAAHGAGIIHRDIKPDNVMIRDDGYVKVLDFGLAKLIGRSGDAATGRPEDNTLIAESPRPHVSESVSTTPGLVMGTVAYMSPEQARGNAVDSTTDIFSLGVVLYELLTRKQPFTGETINHTIVNIIEKEPPPLSTTSAFPVEFEKIIAKCLAKKADQRYQTAKDLIVDLKKLQTQLLFQSEVKKRSSFDAESEPATQILETFPGVNSEIRTPIPVLPNASSKTPRATQTVNHAPTPKPKTKRTLLVIDPNYSRAYSGLAYTYILLDDWFMWPHESVAKARENATKAIAIDETDVDAHLVMALVAHWYDWDWKKAENEFKRAIALNPKNSESYVYYAYFLSSQKRNDEALSIARQGIQIDPLSSLANFGVASTLLFARRWDDAIAHLQNAIKIDSNYWFHRSYLGRAYEHKGMLSEATAEFQRGVDADREQSENWSGLAHAVAVSGKKAEAEKILNDLISKSSAGSYVSPYNIAVIYAGLADKEKALLWLERAYTERSYYLPVYLTTDERLDHLRSETRFKDVIRKIGLPE